MEMRKDVMLRFSWHSQVLWVFSVGELYLPAKRSVEQSSSKKFVFICIYCELIKDTFLKSDQIFSTIDIFI